LISLQHIDLLQLNNSDCNHLLASFTLFTLNLTHLNPIFNPAHWLLNQPLATEGVQSASELGRAKRPLAMQGDLVKNQSISQLPILTQIHPSTKTDSKHLKQDPAHQPSEVLGKA
jgi:hypothetical protein